MSEEQSSYYTDRAFETLTKLLVSQLHPYDKLTDKLAYLTTVRKRCTELLDQMESVQQEPPPVEDAGRKGWFLCQHEAVTIVIPILFKYHMLNKLEGKETFRLYRKSFHNDTWNRSGHPLLAWNVSKLFDGQQIYFNLFSDDRLAPGDLVVVGDHRWVVVRAGWDEDNRIWSISAVTPPADTIAVTFDLSDPKDNPTEVPIYGAPVKV